MCGALLLFCFASSLGKGGLFAKVLPNRIHIPAIAVPGAGLGECRKMRPKLQGAVIPVLKQGLLINSQKFFYLLGSDPTWMLSHKGACVCFYTL